MKCPHCGHLENKVVNSRLAPGGEMIRRRRECAGCDRRFTTNEVLEGVALKIIKRDGRREDFDYRKIRGGLDIACRKRRIETAVLDRLAADVQTALQNRLDKEVTSREIGEMILQRLRDIDHVAYVRFASVYREFEDIEQFQSELAALKSERAASRENR